MHLRRSLLFSLIALFTLLLIGLLVFLAYAPTSARHELCYWLDYWLNRYQTLVSGVLALIAGAFALVAAQRSIAYDRSKERAAAESDRRASILSIEKVISYTSRALSSNHISISLSRYFPTDCLPACLLDFSSVERITFDNLKNLPSPMASKCLFIVYAMRLYNSGIQNLAMATDQPANPTFIQNFQTKIHFLRELEGLMFACEVVAFLLRALGTMSREEMTDQRMNRIVPEVIVQLRSRREVPDREVGLVLRDLDLQVVPPEAW